MSANKKSGSAGPDLEALVQHYLEKQSLINQFHQGLLTYVAESSELRKCVHSVRERLKDPQHLRDKLQRKLREATDAGKPFDITIENLLTRINDLSGIRLLHLHTDQVGAINAALREIVDEQQLTLIEGPVARTWDDESRATFSALGFELKGSNTLYTSVHYVVGSASKTTVTSEIQVRTLAEELWGEVDHTINYPDPIDDVACREQIRALARITSGATRLVDSIFRSHTDYASRTKTKKK